MRKFAPLFYSYMLVSTCFGSSLPSSGSFWIRLSYVKIQIYMEVYHIMWLSGLCVGVSWFSWEAQQTEPRHSQLGSTTDWTTTLPAGKHNRLNHDTPTHRPLNHIDLYFHVTQTDPEAPWRWQTTAETCRNQQNKAVVQICAFCWLFLLRLIMHGANIKFKNHILCSVMFYRKSCRLWDETYGRNGQATDATVIRRMRFAY
jgi:hypothetical protein